MRIQKRKTAIIKEAFHGKGAGDPESMENLKIMFGSQVEEESDADADDWNSLDTFYILNIVIFGCV